MKLMSAGIHPGPISSKSWDSSDTINELDVTAADPTDHVAHVTWQVEKDSEDHPNIGAVAILVAPDGIWDVLGGSSLDQWGKGGGATPIEAKRFPYDGAYSIEIRPAMLAAPLIGGTSGARRLAILPLTVKGVPPRA